VGYALADSPVGQATWIYEKLQAWTQNQGSPEDAIPVDSILDLISLYWFTNSAASSARLYWENKSASFSGGRLELPVAVTIYPYDIYPAPKNWTEDYYPNLIYWNEVEQGGHFAALEVPDLFVTEVRNAFRSLRGL
jgi:pimeloyl-ACP methyl ester carboxylesterase